MKVTVLIENTSDNELICEHGLSMLIEHEGKTILLDAGSSEAFYENAKKMNLSLNELDACVLSHGHYDHSGGFAAIFENNKDAVVYAQRSAINTYYSGSGGMHEIGIPQNVLEYMNRFEFVDGYRKIFAGVYLIPHNTQGLERIGQKSKLYKKQADQIVPDDFTHEQSLVFDTEKGLVIFNSCSHGGVGNIICEVKAVCGDKPIYAYVGGLHMKGKRNGEEVCAFSDEEVDELCNTIRNEKIQYIYTGHCTGIPGLNKMKHRLGDTVLALTTGLKFELN